MQEQLLKSPLNSAKGKFYVLKRDFFGVWYFSFKPESKERHHKNIKLQDMPFSLCWYNSGIAEQNHSPRS